MYHSLKFILIIIFFYCRHSSGMQELDANKAKSSTVNTIIMFCIGGGILVAILVLMGVVICLYYKIADALRPPKAPLCLALKSNPALLTQDKVAAAAALTAGSYPNLQCCDECNLYADFDNLPPCFCDVNEGL
ncbi:protein FAM24B isoform X2 [Lutra lutra]|uniref:Protein FAM24A n=2 Tax=Mustelidae TaxID=9655 RepID=A0A2Y9J3H6_ENHLU|nr:protein FAM24A [Enhydra lutris kenyoni]XP_047557800.1 protein FAM24B isoform X2 [Lutra lutra]